MDGHSLALLLLIQWLIMSCCVAMKSTNIAFDQSALLALKAHITSDPHQILSKNWSSIAPSSSVCDWIGVQCGFKHHRVTALNISDMALVGIIPPHLGNLSFLVSLDMTSNYFHGNLPQELSRLRRLRYIRLGSNNFTGRVPTWFGPDLQVLILTQNEFSGFIPSSISNLSKLEILDFFDNFLTGKIPKEIGNLQSLGHLNLENNQLVGSIPSAIFNISTLESVALTQNNLTGSLPFDICLHLPRLKRLYLSINELNGQIPSTLAHCSQLQILSLSENNFSGFIPKELGNLKMLEKLWLGENNLQGVIPEEISNLHKLELLHFELNDLNGPIPMGIFNLSTLRELQFQFNHLTGSLPSNIGYQLPTIEIFVLNDNEISGVIPASIGNCSKLTGLSLAYNQFSGSIPKSLGNLELLERLYLSDNYLTSDPTLLELDFLTSLTNCKSLESLDLANNPLNGILPNSIGNLSTSLQYLLVDMSKIRGPIPSEIGNLTSLLWIAIGDNQLNGAIPRAIQDLKNLQVLSLERNKLGASLDNFCNMKRLVELYLSQNQISGPIPDCFGSMTSLRKLYLDYNSLTSSIPRSIWKLTYLLDLVLASNSLNGSLPIEIGNLKAAISIDLSTNQISGAIPITLGDLQNLQNLSLANNQLQESIPESFGNMLSLTSLDLSHNNLSGSIPKSLEKLQSLKLFDVSSNHLKGEIPSGGPFENFTSESFTSNDALCGDPKFHVPQCQTNQNHQLRVGKMLLLTLIPLVIALLAIISLVFVLLRYRRKSEFSNTIEVSSVPTTERISYYELLQATNRFSESNLLGSGSFGSVYKGILNDGKSVAVKVFNLQLEGSLKSFDVECEVFCSLRHRNLVKVISSCSNQNFKALVLEYMPNGSLDKWLHSDNHFLNILQRLDMMIDVACALQYLHQEYSTLVTVIHCDLKPSNILIDEDMVAHVSDFGMAKFLGKDESIALTKTLATIGYIAPEYGREGSISKACDVYSYGILLMEVFTRRRPNDELFGESMDLKSWVNNAMPDSIFQVIDTTLLKENQEHSNETLECVTLIMELALNCVPESPKERVTISEVVGALKKTKLRYACHGSK